MKFPGSPSVLVFVAALFGSLITTTARARISCTIPRTRITSSVFTFISSA